MAIDMTGKVAVVTGAASGVGRATARRLAAAGARLCLIDVDGARLAETAASLPEGAAMTETIDLADAAACQAVIARTAERLGRLDALCNVAGVLRLAHTPDMPEREFRRVMDVNLSAAFFLSQAAIPHLLATEGAIVNVASLAAFIGEAYAAAYCASKWGLVGLTKAMAMEYLKHPIRINAVAPGGMNTAIGADFRPPEGADMTLLARFRPVRGLVEVDDVAEAIVMLATPAGRGFHGACLNLDAGATAG